MSNDKEPLLNEIEKKNLLETVGIIRQIVQEISTKKKRSIWGILKHPLIILLVGSLISGLFVFQYQKRYERTAERVRAKYDLSNEVTDEIFLNVGEIISKAKVIVNLHSEAINYKDQIVKANKAYNAAYDKFISNFPKIRFKLKIVFKNGKINRWWSDTQNRVNELDKLLNLLLEDSTIEISETHSERIDLNEKKIKEIKSELNLLYDFVIEAFE